jgi:hypothetical protein
MLPFQAVFCGKTNISLPRPGSRGYAEAEALGFKLEPSMTTKYWSTQRTMKTLVTDIIAPYFNKKKAELNLPATQCSLWKIDCWSVHRSEEFRSWLKRHHPTILLCFVPANCTGLFQPLDVGIQRPMKQCMKRSSHKDVVEEASALLNRGGSKEAADPTVLKLDTTVGTLRNRCIGWMVDAYHGCNKKDLILKVESMLPGSLYLR